jgi:nitric oxide synthase oxygenase domain/subunit
VKLVQLEITPVEMRCIRRTAKYTWQGSLSELKINPLVKKIQNYKNKWIQHVRQMDRDRQTGTLNYAVLTMWEGKPRTTP